MADEPIDLKARREQAEREGHPELMPPIKLSISFPAESLQNNVTIHVHWPALLLCLAVGFAGGALASLIM